MSMVSSGSASSASQTYLPPLPKESKMLIVKKANFGVVRDVKMDAYKVVVATGNEGLATSGLMTCFAICSRGFNMAGRSVLGLAHTSHILDVKKVIAFLRQKMTEKGCLPFTIEVLVVGGMKADAKADNPGTQEEEEAVLSIAKSERVVETLFNYAKREKAVSVVFNAYHLCVTRGKKLFTSQDDGKSLFR